MAITARFPASTLKSAYDLTFDPAAGANQVLPRLILTSVPANLSTPYAATLSGGGYSLPGGHPFVVGEMVRLSVAPVAPAPDSHPYYWIKSITSGVATISAVGPDAADASLTATAATINFSQIDLPMEVEAWDKGADSAAPGLVFSATLLKSEVTFGAGPRPEITHTATPQAILPAGWPTTGELVYGVEADQYTLTNGGASAIVYRHIILQMGGGGAATQGGPISNPSFFAAAVNTSIPVAGSMIFNFRLGISEQCAGTSGGGGGPI